MLLVSSVCNNCSQVTAASFLTFIKNIVKNYAYGTGNFYSILKFIPDEADKREKNKQDIFHKLNNA